MSWFHHFFCRHTGGLVFIRNIYGDEINHLNARSIWRCKRCGRAVYKQELHKEQS